MTSSWRRSLPTAIPCPARLAPPWPTERAMSREEVEDMAEQARKTFQIGVGSHQAGNGRLQEDEEKKGMAVKKSQSAMRRITSRLHVALKQKHRSVSSQGRTNLRQISSVCTCWDTNGNQKNTQKTSRTDTEEMASV